MRKHTLVGERIIGASPSMAPVARLVRSSHERWDGERLPGRPGGRGDPTRGPDHLRLRRLRRDAERASLRDPRDQHDALAEIRRGAGTQFDPHLAEVFCASSSAASTTSHRPSSPRRDHRAHRLTREPAPIRPGCRFTAPMGAGRRTAALGAALIALVSALRCPGGLSRRRPDREPPDRHPERSRLRPLEADDRYTPRGIATATSRSNSIRRLPSRLGAGGAGRGATQYHPARNSTNRVETPIPPPETRSARRSRACAPTPRGSTPPASGGVDRDPGHRDWSAEHRAGGQGAPQSGRAAAAPTRQRDELRELRLQRRRIVQRQRYADDPRVAERRRRHLRHGGHERGHVPRRLRPDRHLLRRRRRRRERLRRRHRRLGLLRRRQRPLRRVELLQRQRPRHRTRRGGAGRDRQRGRRDRAMPEVPAGAAADGTRSFRPPTTGRSPSPTPPTMASTWPRERSAG